MRKKKRKRKRNLQVIFTYKLLIFLDIVLPINEKAHLLGCAMFAFHLWLQKCQYTLKHDIPHKCFLGYELIWLEYIRTSIIKPLPKKSITVGDFFNNSIVFILV